MQTVLKTVGYILLAVLLAGSSYLFYTQAAPYFEVPCEKPLTYKIGKLDSEFGLSREEFSAALSRAASVWNTEAGKVVLIEAKEGEEIDVPVNLIYGELQKTSELGDALGREQADFDTQKALVEQLRDKLLALRKSYDAEAARFDRAAAKYHEEVAYWNSQGGAPEEEYRALGREQKRLQNEQKELQEQAEELNVLVEKINVAVDSLNEYARKLNAKVGVYNERAGEDFDQGHYQSDGNDAKIEIFQFENEADLTRVLAHEFGHALSLGHVENPESIMYSYNIGSSLSLSPEDLAALKIACQI